MKQEKSQESNSVIHPALSIVIYIIGVILLTVSLSALILPLAQGLLMNQSGKLFYYMVAESCLLVSVVAMACVMLRYVEHRPLSDLGLTWRERWIDACNGLTCACIMLLVGLQTMFILDSVDVVRIRFYPVDFFVSWFFFAMVAFAEEIMVRGFILGHLLRTRMNKFLALLLSSLVFAAGHLFNPDIAFLPMVNLVLAGLLLGASYLYERNLWFPISFHLFWNWVQGPVMGYDVSGNRFGKTLLTLHYPESDYINGGAFGFEGSIVCTVLLIVVTAGIIWHYEMEQRVTL
ncbi:CPBP family intramembrane glutamic endopeptidase [Bacteroides sp.]